MTYFLVWSNEHRMWWRASHHGYTDAIEEAGRYARAEAEAIVSQATLDGLLTYRRRNPVTGEEYSQVAEVMVLAPECLAPEPVASGEQMQPPPCADHESSQLNCPVCSAQRRAFYAALGRSFEADDVPPNAGSAS